MGCEEQHKGIKQLVAELAAVGEEVSSFGSTPRQAIDAKEETHWAYEKLRESCVRKAPPSNVNLRTAQKRITARVVSHRSAQGRSPDYPVRRAQMPTKITYARSLMTAAGPRWEEPASLRRTETDEEQNDEQFGHDLEWTYSPLLYSYERGNMDNKLYEITEDEANQIASVSAAR